MAIAGLDVGTSGSKCTIFHDDGSVSAYSYREYALERSSRGYVELNPDRVWEAVRTVIAEASAGHKGGPVRALCITSCGEMGVPVDREGRALYGSMPYTDPRGQEQCDRLIARLGRGEIMTRSGHNPHPMYSAPKIMWLRDNEPDVYRRMVTFLQYSDFILFRLTGEKAVDWSLASRTLMFNVAKKEWDPVLLDAAGLRADQFPRPVQAGTPVAAVLPSVAGELGLSPSTVVLLGGQDQIGAVVGGGAMEPRVAANGTGSVDCITPVFDRPNTGEAMRRYNFACVPYIRPDYYVTYAFSFYGGALLKWYRDKFAQDAVREAKARGVSVYTYLESTAPDEPTGLLVLPHLSGAATPYMDIHSVGAIVGLTADTDRGTLYRGLMEGVAYEMRINLDCLREAGVPVDRLIATGGGSRSPMWMQMRADLFNLPVSVPQVEEAGTLGAAIMAGAACGLYRDIAEGARQLVRIRRTFEPDPALHDRYEELYAKYRRVYDCVREIQGRRN